MWVLMWCVREVYVEGVLGVIEDVCVEEVWVDVEGVMVCVEVGVGGGTLEIRVEYCVVVDGVNSETRMWLGIVMWGKWDL